MATIPIEFRRRTTAAKLAALTLANAFIFQEQLSQANAEVEPLRRLLEKRDFHSAVADHWKFICETINYVPIFSLARDVLIAIPSSADNVLALKTLAKYALQIVSERAALRHDLMGRVYHYLLLEAKFLGTFYTSVPAATLLLKLALQPSKWNLDWSDMIALKKFLVADLACGTGTLLMAVSQAVTDNFVRAMVQKASAVDGKILKQLHQVLMEDVLHGYDVLPTAVHLTASTLALLAPEIAFKKMQLYSLPLGKLPDGSIYLGSIDYLNSNSVQTQLDLMGTGLGTGAAGSLSGTGVKASVAPLPDVDLCVMNPPFVRSVGGNLLFGSLPQWRKEMQKELSRRMRPGRGTEVLASSTAGLGSVFTAIADRHIKPGGRIALVIPAAITTGVAWAKTRALINARYDLEYLVTSHDANKWNFSENTELSEILLVARKRDQAAAANGECLCINLWRNPTTTADALSLSELVLTKAPASSQLSDHGISSMQLAGTKWGESISIPSATLKVSSWVGGAFAQTDMVRTLLGLADGMLKIPTGHEMHRIPVVSLGKIATLGPDRRDIADGFNPISSSTPYPAFWGHNADDVTTIAAEPNKWLAPVSVAKRGRPRRDASLLWSRAGRVMIAERMWLFTQRLTASRLANPCLSNVWWPTTLIADDARHEKALTLWLNSTLGLILFVGFRVPTRGPWVQFKKPTLKVMPVLDVTNLKDQQLRILSGAFDQIARAIIEPLPRMAEDRVRASIDSAFELALGLPNLAPLRALLAQEPIICNRPLGEIVADEIPESEQFDLLLQR
jgi:hypothetical protein